MTSINSIFNQVVHKCPFETNEHDCVFKIIQNLPVKERLEYLKKISNIEKAKMMKHHIYCKTKREDHSTIEPYNVSDNLMLLY